MSTVTINPGDLVTFDPSDKRLVVFDFDTRNLASGVQLSGVPTITITAIRQIGATALTSDNASLLAGNRKAQARFLATTATVGDRYEISIKGVTNETPTQEKTYSFFILVQDR